MERMSAAAAGGRRVARGGAGARARCTRPNRPAPTAATASSDDLAFAEFDQRMTVPVQIAGAGPYPFIIDTGAQRSVVSRQLAHRLALLAGRAVSA